MRSSYFLYIFCVVLLLCSSVQVVSAEPGYSFEKAWSIEGQIDNAHGIAIDSTKNVFIADTNNNRILKYTSDGTLLTSLGNGRLINPDRIAVDNSGNVYVTDTGNYRIHKFTSAGTFITEWGTQGSGDGQFANTIDIAVDNSGNVYVTDMGNYRIQKFTSIGTFITKWGSYGSEDGQFNNLEGIAVDMAGNVYVTDSTSTVEDREYTKKFTSNGTFLIKWAIYSGFPSDWPNEISVDTAGDVYIISTFGGISKYTSSGEEESFEVSNNYYIRAGTAAIDATVDSTGNVYILSNYEGMSWVWVCSSTGMIISEWGETRPYYIAADGTGNVYVIDSVHTKIVKFTSTGTYLTSWGSVGSGFGQFKDPHGIAVDRAGNVYVADTGNNRVQKFTTNGNFTLQWIGRDFNSTGYANGPQGITVDSSGYVYSFWDNWFQKFTPNGGFVNAVYFPSNGASTATSIAVDRAGNIYWADQNYGRLRKITSAGKIADPPSMIPSTWSHIWPYGVVIDNAGCVYVTDEAEWRGFYKYASDGTLIWGGGMVPHGDPGGMAVDDAGNVYIANPYYNSIVKFAPEASLTTDFTATPTFGTAPLTVQFTDTSTGSITAWQWDFNNDGIVDSTLQNPTFTYTAPGNYSVKLSVTGTGGTGSTVKRNYIAVNGGISVDSVTPDSAVLTVDNVAVSVRGKNFPAGTTFKLVNATLGTITCQPNTITRVSDTELTGKMSFTDVKAGFYDVVVTTPDGTTKSLEKGFRVLPVPVVLIYGWHGAPGAWDVLRPALSKEGIDYWDFDYNTSIDPTVSANTLSDFIQKKRLTYKRDLYPNGYTGKIDIVCHSMGAIVSRWYMEQKGHGNEIRQWIGIAPAHGGSAGADSQSFQNEASDDSTITGWQYLICSIFGDSTRYLQTNSVVELILKYDQISPSTTYRVIAGWNPHHDVQFGYGALYRTRAVAPNGSYYWTFNGDMIVAAAQSYQKGMGFDCFPILNEGEEGGNYESRCNFSHVHIHHSPAVINRVIKYLENPKLPKNENIPVDPNENEPYDISVIKTVADRIQTWQINYVIEHPFVIPFILKYGDSSAMSGSGTTVTDELLVDLNWTEGGLSLELTAPDGQKFTSATNTATAWSMSDSNHVLFTIVSPAAGNWSAKIIPMSLPNHPIGYNLTMYRSQVNATLEVDTPIVAVVPGGSAVPHDLTGSGLYKDVNGNGAIDFNDVVLYFNQMDFISTNEPVAAFDFNKNGQIDFNDIVMLFNEM